MTNINTTEVEGLKIVKIEGDIIGEENGLQIIEVITDELESGVKTLAVDLSEVRYMNSSGIGMLITLHTKFKNKSGELCLVSPTDQIRKLLSITKLDSIFTIVDSVEEAVETLK